VGTDQPTDPDPGLNTGGENAWTGGNGRRIVCQPTAATHLRISGGYDFSDTIDIYEVVVNPSLVLHRVDPVDGISGSEEDLWNIGTGPSDTRTGPETLDGNFQTRVDPKQLFSFTLDAGITPRRLDDPNNMDMVERSFDLSTEFTGLVGTGGLARISLPGQPVKRFIELEVQEAFDGGTQVGIGEIEILGAPAGVALPPIIPPTFTPTATATVTATPTPTEEPVAVDDWPDY